MAFIRVKVAATRHLCLPNIKTAISNSELLYLKFYVHFLHEKKYVVLLFFQLLISMSARTFVVVYVTFSPRSHPCQTGVHLYPSTYSTKAATGRKAAQRCRAPQPGRWHHHHSVPLTPRRSLLPLALLPWPAEHLPGTSVCLHLRSGQGDGLEVTSPFFEGREENSGY